MDCVGGFGFAQVAQWFGVLHKQNLIKTSRFQIFIFCFHYLNLKALLTLEFIM